MYCIAFPAFLQEINKKIARNIKIDLQIKVLCGKMSWVMILSRFQTVFLIITALFCIVTVGVNVVSLPYALIEQNNISNEISSEDNSTETKLININTATLEELQCLPGIGETRAKEIVHYRELHGGFFVKEELMNVKGIGRSLFDTLKDLITV